MAQLTILEYPNPRLRLEAKPVEKFDDDLQQIIDDMFETMYAAPGIGLAATQVDVQLNIVTMDLSDDKSEPIVLINPEVIEKRGIEEMEEGCLSFPGVYVSVERANEVHIKALDRHGEPFEIDTGGLLAVCIQHELDHLAGKLFVDYLSPLKRNRIKKKLEKQAK